MLFVCKSSNFLLNCFISQFSMEHFFFLVNKFLHILCTLFSRKLYSWASNVLCCVNISSLLAKIISHYFICLCRSNVSVSNPLQRCSTRRSIFFPDFLRLKSFFCLFFSCFLSLTSYKNFLIIWRTERWFSSVVQLLLVITDARFWHLKVKSRKLNRITI